MRLRRRAAMRGEVVSNRCGVLIIARSVGRRIRRAVQAAMRAELCSSWRFLCIGKNPNPFKGKRWPKRSQLEGFEARRQHSAAALLLAQKGGVANQDPRHCCNRNPGVGWLSASSTNEQSARRRSGRQHCLAQGSRWDERAASLRFIAEQTLAAAGRYPSVTFVTHAPPGSPCQRALGLWLTLCAATSSTTASPETSGR
jgi:hypothetical protein